MIFGKYINKYYLKYAIFFIIGVAALVVVDIAQIFEPKYLGTVVDILAEGGPLSDAQKSDILRAVIATLIIGATMMLGRFLWRVTIFHATFKIGSDLRKEMFLKAERLSVRYYHLQL